MISFEVFFCLQVLQVFLNLFVLGVTLIFSDIRRLGPFLGVQNFEFQYFLFIYFLGGRGGVRKMNIFGGMKIVWIFLGGHHNFVYI